MTMMLGADPEFEVQTKGGIFRNASGFFSTDTSEKLGCDGCSNTGELRPAPGDGKFVTNEIKGLLTRAFQRIGANNRLIGGCGVTVSLGGHIHLSDVARDSTILAMLDKFIAIPLRQVSNTRIRDNHGYGRLSEYRSQPWGWEYRAPCSWIIHPAIVKGVLLTAEYIAKAKTANRTLLEFDDLYNFVAETSQEDMLTVKRFQHIVYSLIQNNRKIESMEVFNGWGFMDNVATTVIQSKIFRFEFSSDYLMDQINRELDYTRINLSHILPVETIRICGASDIRANFEPAFFVPVRLRPVFPLYVQHTKVLTWDLDTIGITRKLREVYSPVKIASMLNELRRYAKRNYFKLSENNTCTIDREAITTKRIIEGVTV